MIEKSWRWKSVTRAGLAVLLVMALSVPLWYPPAPVKALTIDVDNPSSGTAGSTYTFTVRVDIKKTDIMPVQSVDLQIYNTASPDEYAVTFSNLPLPAAAETTASGSYAGDGGTASVLATSGPGWGLDMVCRFAFGYSYEWRSWTYIILSLPYSPASFGYGWLPGFGVDETYLNYTVTWTPPADWPADSYEIRAVVWGDNVHSAAAFTNDSAATFSLAAAENGQAGAPTTTPPTALTTTPAAATQETTLPATTTPQPSPEPESKTNWLVIAVVVAAVIAALIVWRLVLSQRRD